MLSKMMTNETGTNTYTTQHTSALSDVTRTRTGPETNSNVAGIGPNWIGGRTERTTTMEQEQRRGGKAEAEPRWLGPTESNHPAEPG